MLRQRDIEDSNEPMKVSAFLKMCRLKQLIPHSLNIERLNQLIRQCITPMTNEEYEYLVENRMLIKVYEKDMNPETSHCEPSPGEPGLLFHEFIFLLAMIALNKDTDVVEASEKIESFFIIKLELTKVPEDYREYKSFDAHLEKAQVRAAGLRPDDDGSDDDLFSDNEGEDEMDRFEIDEKQKQFKQFLEEKA